MIKLTPKEAKILAFLEVGPRTGLSMGCELVGITEASYERGLTLHRTTNYSINRMREKGIAISLNPEGKLYSLGNATYEFFWQKVLKQLGPTPKTAIEISTALDCLPKRVWDAMGHIKASGVVVKKDRYTRQTLGRGHTRLSWFHKYSIEETGCSS